jgi:hypothetical protein
MKYSDDDGYILEVDLEYPKELHDLEYAFTSRKGYTQIPLWKRFQ